MHSETKNLCLALLQYSLYCSGLEYSQYPWGMPVLVVAIRGLRVCTISYTWDWPQFAEEAPYLEDLRLTVTLLRLLLLLLSRFSPVWLCATPQTAAHQAPLSLRFSRQEYWSGVPLPVFKPTSGYFVCNNFFSSSSLTGSKVDDRLLTVQFDQDFHYWFQRLLSNLLNLPLSVFYHSCNKLP